MRAGADAALMRPYVAFNAALRVAFSSFVGRLQEQARALLAHHLEVLFVIFLL